MSYKYYRYDARGRVIKMWNYIAGLGMKTFDYNYNSQNQITELIYQSGYSDTKTFRYAYDYAGRLLNTSINYIPQDSPEDYLVFNSYTYNQNSQINTSKFDPINYTHTYSYDSRNRITNFDSGKPDLFSYNLTYYSNSNIQTQSFTGQYKNSFSNQDNISTSFTYDKSNRLLNANFTNTSDNTFDLTNTFDPDGNILTMQRYGSNNNLTDNFTYDYYSGTNRLKKVSGSSDQYTYDYNGNQTNDYLNNNTSIKYDHRNLITEFTKQDLAQDPPRTDITRYKYDEAGNRVRKTIYRSSDSNPPPLPEETEDLPTGWSIILDDYYLREVSGKEIAIYSSYTLQYWNVWSGNEIVGRINNNENADRNYYLKDHLGSIRAVLDNSKNIVSANDYDMWGYYLQNRTYSTTNTKNKFTGKERDNESTYDYFGARYYDARVANWGSIDPLFKKHIQWTPYNYVLRNPLALIDPDGKQIDFNKFINQGGLKSNINDIKESLEFVTGFKYSLNNNQLNIVGESMSGSNSARNYIRQAIKNKQKVEFTTGQTQANFITGNIEYNPSQIEKFIDNSKPGYTFEKQGHGISFIEEVIHLIEKVDHPKNLKLGDVDFITGKVNDIRSELGLDPRLSYEALDLQGESYLPFDESSLIDMQNASKKSDKSFIDKNAFERRLTNFTKY